MLKEWQLGRLTAGPDRVGRWASPLPLASKIVVVRRIGSTTRQSGEGWRSNAGASACEAALWRADTTAGRRQRWGGPTRFIGGLTPILS